MTDIKRTEDDLGEDDYQKIRHCIGLLNSIVRSGESHSITSRRMTVEALEAIDRIETPNSDAKLDSPLNRYQKK